MLDDKKWVKLNNFTESVGDIGGIYEINNVCYVVGGNGISTLNNNFYKFPSNEDHFRLTSCRVGNNILVIREFHGVEGKLFNPTSKQWSDVNIETRRTCFSVAHYNNKVWIVGGSDNFKTTNTIQIYDPNINTFSLSPIKMIYARRFHKMIVYKNKLFVFGGCDDDSNRLNTVEMYSPNTIEFVMMAPMKIARESFACCRVGNLVYCIGGLTVGREHTKSVEVYNLDTNVWCDGTNFPIADSHLHACAVNNKLA